MRAMILKEFRQLRRDRRTLPKPFTVAATNPASASPAAWAQDQPRDGHAAVAIVTGSAPGPTVLIDGSQLFTAQAALRQFVAQSSGQVGTTASVNAAVAGVPAAGRLPAAGPSAIFLFE